MTTTGTATAPRNYINAFAIKSRDRIAAAHRAQGREVTREFDTAGHLHYLVQTDGRPTHLITVGGNGEGYEYRLPADANPYLTVDLLLRTATTVRRYF